MTITHAAIYTLDLERLKDFYCRWFGGEAGPAYENPEKGFSSRFVRFERGAALELMHRAHLKESVRGEFTAGYAHLAFSAESEEAVENLTKRMREGGVPVVSGPRRTGDGCFESCVLDPDGNRVEITAERRAQEK